MAHGKEEPNTASVILLEDGEAMEAATNNKGKAQTAESDESKRTIDMRQFPRKRVFKTVQPKRSDLETPPATSPSPGYHHCPCLLRDHHTENLSK